MEHGECDQKLNFELSFSMKLNEWWFVTFGFFFFFFSVYRKMESDIGVVERIEEEGSWRRKLEEETERDFEKGKMEI